jgi:beta-lactamase class A
MRTYILPVLLLILILNSCSSREPLPNFEAIEAKLNDLVASFEGDVGIYVKHLPTGNIIEIQADTIFPTASTIKVPLMIRAFEMMESGELHYDSTHVYQDRLYYPGSDVVASFKDGQTISLHKLLFLSISFSDNTASLWIQELGGTGTKVNEAMERLGLVHTRVNSRTEGRTEDFRRYGWGQTTPREMATILERIYKSEVISAEHSEEMYRLMSKSLWDKEALAMVPKNINVASKQGAVSASKSEVVLVNAPTGDYVFCVITKNQSDRRWEDDNAGNVLLRNVSRILWEELGN